MHKCAYCKILRSIVLFCTVLRKRKYDSTELLEKVSGCHRFTFCQTQNAVDMHFLPPEHTCQSSIKIDMGPIGDALTKNIPEKSTSMVANISKLVRVTPISTKKKK